MSKHTPGPWTVGKPTCPGVDGQRGIWAGKRGIADVYGHGHDARLIAAAPELLAAGERCLMALAANGAPNCEAAKEMRAAIAKATGAA